MGVSFFSQHEVAWEEKLQRVLPSTHLLGPTAAALRLTYTACIQKDTCREHPYHIDYWPEETSDRTPLLFYRCLS